MRGVLSDADRADHGAGVEHLGAAVGVGDLDRPTSGRVVEGHGVDARVQPAVLLEVVRVHDPLEVGAQLGVLREVLGPVVGGLERVAVEVAADVDARTRVAVLPPRAAGTAVLLDDRERRFACARRSAASNPDSPHPMTTTCESARTSSGISSAHVIARASAPSRWRSSRNIGHDVVVERRGRRGTPSSRG